MKGALAPWRELPWVVGAYATEVSQIVLIAEDGHVGEHETSELRAIPLATLRAKESCGLDDERYQARLATVLHDPTGEVARCLGAMAELPSSIRDDRLRVHFAEYIRERAKATVCLERGLAANARMTASSALNALVKCVFMAMGSWVPRAEHTARALRASVVPPELVDGLERAWDALDVNIALHQAVDAWLTSLGHDFHRNPHTLTEWMTRDPRGIAAVERWFRTP
ncbi:MAG TPA: hypothetical protein VGM39_02880 [Kofleriaceae bacterium]|jgi:hypothetical protein